MCTSMRCTFSCHATGMKSACAAFVSNFLQVLMLPFIVAGGVLLALAVMASGKGAVPADGLLADISNIGIKGLVLFPIILGGFIGYSIADKPALAPAMISSGIMADMGGGFLGCIVAGFIAGGVVFQLKKIPKYVKTGTLLNLSKDTTAFPGVG